MISAYLKVTNYCNVGCDFCYLPEGSRADRTRMSKEVLAGAIKTAELQAATERSSSVLYIIHGGEPLSLSPDILDSFCNDIAELATLPYELSLQTSLIPLRPQHIPVIQKHFKGVVGSSIDFSGRMINSSSDDYISLWLKKIDLGRSGGLDVYPIFVPGKKDLGRAKEIVDWMINNSFLSFSLERFNTYGNDSSDKPTNKEHARFLIDISRVILDYAEKGIFVANNVFQAAIAGVHSGVSGDRWGGSCIRNFLVINPDGETNFCPDKIEFASSFGNVKDAPEYILKSKDRIKASVEYVTGHKNSFCTSCEFSAWCNSGCPITENSIANGGECSGYKSYLNWVGSVENSTIIHYYNMTHRGGRDMSRVALHG